MNHCVVHALMLKTNVAVCAIRMQFDAQLCALHQLPASLQRPWLHCKTWQRDYKRLVKRWLNSKTLGKLCWRQNKPQCKIQQESSAESETGRRLYDQLDFVAHKQQWSLFCCLISDISLARPVCRSADLPCCVCCEAALGLASVAMMIVKLWSLRSYVVPEQLDR